MTVLKLCVCVLPLFVETDLVRQVSCLTKYSLPPVSVSVSVERETHRERETRRQT